MTSALPPALSVHELTAYYGPVAACRAVSLDVAAGQAVGVTGPNGAGKSSLVMAIVGLIRAEGRVSMRGTDVSRWPASRRIDACNLAYVPQDHVVIPSLTVTDTLRLYGTVKRIRPAELAQRQEAVYDFFPELARRRTGLAGTLSGGERQMLGLARLLMGPPGAIAILDEPTAGLAPTIAHRLSGFVRALRDGGQSMLVIEHNEEVLAACGRVFEMTPTSMREVPLSAARVSTAPARPSDED